jgi:hypothetical protein
MHLRIYYDKSGTPWSGEEETSLIKEYSKEELSIMQIGDIHKRTPGGIAYQLKRLKVIEKNTDARGYEEYRQSSLYKEITGISNPKENQTSPLLKGDEFSRAGEYWSGQESQQLMDEYQKQELDLLEICKIHKRKPAGIAAQLYRLNIITNRSLARGYSEYKKSDLFKSLRTERKERTIVKTNTSLASIKEINISNNLLDTLDLVQIRKEIISLNEKITRLISLLENKNTLAQPLLKKNLVNTHLKRNIILD